MMEREHSPEDAMTSITITDPALLAEVAAAGTVEVKGPDGRVVVTLVRNGLPPGAKPSPLTDEERAARRNLPGSGIPLAEFWKRMDEGTWR